MDTDSAGATPRRSARRSQLDRQRAARSRTQRAAQQDDFGNTIDSGTALQRDAATSSSRRSASSRTRRAQRDASDGLFDDSTGDSTAESTPPARRRRATQRTAPDLEPNLDENQPSPNATSAANRISGFTGDGGSPNSRSASNAVSGFNPRGTRAIDTDFDDRNGLAEDDAGTDDNSNNTDPNSPLFDESQNTSAGSSQQRRTANRESLDDANLTDDSSTGQPRTDSTGRFRNDSQRNGTGLDFSRLQRRLGIDFSDDATGGLTVDRVTPDSLAARAGFQAGDELLLVNDQPVNSLADLGRLVGRNGRASITVNRGGEEVSVSLNLAQFRALADRARRGIDDATDDARDDDTGTTNRTRTRPRRSGTQELDRSLLFD